MVREEKKKKSKEYLKTEPRQEDDSLGENGVGFPVHRPLLTPGLTIVLSTPVGSKF